MSSMEIQNPVFNDDDLDESDEDSDEEEEESAEVDHNAAHPPQPQSLNDAVVDEEEEEDDDVIDLDTANDDDDEFSSDRGAVTIAVPPPPHFSKSDQKRPQVDQVEKKVQPLDDSRKLFQRLWTDDDEIELLQGFLEYMTQRGISYHNHHDLGQFYEQIKSKLQLDFNKNQLVEKMRRLKRKYRNVLNRTCSGKEISFKSPHDQATYEISRKIWSDLSSIKDGGAGGGNGLDDADVVLPLMPIPVPHLSPSPSYSFFGHNNNTPVHYSAQVNGIFDERKSHSSKKRSRSKIEDKRVSDDRVLMPNFSPGLGGPNASVGLGPQIQGLIEETVKSCLSPLVKEAINSATNGLCGIRGGFGGIGGVGIGLLSPLLQNFGSPSVSLGGEISDRKWRKQQIMELEVYSKRLELVQEQIKVALDELRSGRS